MATAALGRRASWQLLQSDFGRPDHNGNFEAVVLEDRGLAHYFHDNSDVDSGWKFKQIIAPNATGPGSIIQSDFGSGAVGNFEVVVLEENNLVHWFHDNSNPDLPWSRPPRFRRTITPNARGPGSIIQSNLGSGPHGNFEVVVPEKDPALQRNVLRHYFLDNSDPLNEWTPALTISETATGSGSIIQSTFGTPGQPGNLEVVVLEQQPNKPTLSQLSHYFFDPSNPELGWQRSPHTISTLATDAASIIQSDFGTPDHPGNFEVVVLEGRNLVHYWHDNSNVDSDWKRTLIPITDHAIDPGSIIQSDFVTPGHLGNFEVVVPEEDGLFHYFRDNSTLEWRRTGQYIPRGP